jgi:hypothetical protein
MALRLTAPARWVPAVAVAGVTAIVLAACGGDRPDGVDGDLTNQWGGFAEAARFAPAAQVCHPDGYQPTAPLPDYRPVGCDQPHLLETVHVGSFEDVDEAAELDTAPAPDSSEHRQAYRECEKQTADYLGANFREGRLWLGVAVPSAAGWDGGARWFRCDLMEVESVYGDAVERQSTLAGQLAGDSADPDLQLGCYQVAVDDSDVAELSPVACDETHEAEFVGIWRAPESGRASGGGYPDGDAEEEVYDGCREQVADYVDVPVDGNLVFRTGTIADWMSEQEWAAGDRAFRCYLWLPDRKLTESLAGDGDDALPIQTE